ncbi:nucleoside hydrolase-like domain-containing protein [Adhaeribacter rhizoryzae]|uniref:DUF1593 domain-containing protein n=1 Tax=Adhaeribacter rhizoryzae TaxID=2607907 RepID=A0A5M6D1H7_9BACT|nr:nucleoside hydrolase-like domain-containing protein [Adhaeribacter rhizoryzae]KAA5540876.1 DUF1593 domain-containing protein [Adhaeribacter rhizoryzae]
MKALNLVLKAIAVLLLVAIYFPTSAAKPRVIVSTDIGGTDPDDFQSLIHYLMYADKFQTEGLISSPYGEGRKKHILQILDLYEQDYPKLKAHIKDFPSADGLRAVTKQGALDRAPGKGWSKPSEGSRWIIECARRKSSQPLWVLVWGGIDDLAQALHDAPDITDKLRVYFIAGPNKKWSADAYQYVAQNFPNLWMIEANSTYSGWFIDNNQEGDLGNEAFYEKFIRGNGAMGKDFGNYYKGSLKMGDSPTVTYLLQGDPEKPANPNWGGSFVPLKHSSRRIFNRQTTLADQVPVYAVVEWVMQGPDQGPAHDKPVLWLETENQKFEGYYEGNGKYRARFVPKKVGEWSYVITSPVTAINGQKGQFTSVAPWPGAKHADDISPLNKWWSDNPDPALFMGASQGALTVGRFREAFLQDWAKRWAWLE